ncbi:MAG: PIN domain nuclease, partial [bacterium]|nr:PIN domain nuclease [bacterium]
QEVLQGIRAEREQHQISYYLLRFPFLPTTKSVYISAASIYRNLRRKGITIPSVDATIAAIAIEYGVPLFTLDKHFESIVSVTRLKLYQA